MKKQLIFTSIAIILLALLIHNLKDKSSYTHHTLKRLLGVKSLQEFLLHYEIDRGDKIPERLPECTNNITNKQFYFDHHGAQMPCIFRDYLNSSIIDQLKLESQEWRPEIMDKNFQFIQFSVVKHGFKRTVTQSQGDEQFVCSINSQIRMAVLTPFQSLLIKFDDDGVPKNESILDIVQPNFERYPQLQDAFIFPVILGQSDCVYIPAYFWQQYEATDPNAIIAKYEYKVGSDWVRLVFDGIQQGLL